MAKCNLVPIELILNASAGSQKKRSVKNSKLLNSKEKAKTIPKSTAKVNHLE